MVSRIPPSPALIAPSLLTQNARLQADLTDIIERSRDLCWWGRRVVGGAVSPYRHRLRGGAPDDDAASVLGIITRVALCQECISRKSGVPVSRVDALVTTLSGTFVLSVETRRCTSCLRAKTTYGFEGRAHPGASTRETERPNGTQRAILNFLAQHAGSAYCAACISGQLFDGKDIDVAMRHVEGAGVYRRHERCSSCQRVRLIARLPAAN